MNNRQKLGYMALGAGILALGMAIGQWTTPDIKAQRNGVFDKIVCRELEVVDKDGKKAIVLQSNEHDRRGSLNQVVVYQPRSKHADVVGIELNSSPRFNEVIMRDKSDKYMGVWLYSNEVTGNSVTAFQPGTHKVGGALKSNMAPNGLYINENQISLDSTDKENLISVQDIKEDPECAAFQIYSNNDGNYSVRWIRGKGRRADW